ncbi:MAG TPA: response regulator transcription factor [Syntrophomonadaceae bacterium]|nr:response regulator transcription factor [Syntrophomonadaceae bacterium]
METVLILEDEEYTLEFLELLVSKHPLVDKVLAVNDSRSAVTAAQNYLPQIALLDIELAPGDSFNGIETAEMITRVSPNTVLVFLTGYGKYALGAYSAHPYDYLLKPVQKEKLNNMITEIITKKESGANSKMPLKVKEGTILLSPDSLLCIEKNGKKALIYTDQDTYESNYNLNELENLLSEQFARVHNSYIVNLSKIRMIKYTNSRSYQVLIDGCPAIAYMSRKKYEKYKHLFSPDN